MWAALTTQSDPVRIETGVTSAIILEMIGGGGTPRVALSHADVLDFGRCMVGRALHKHLVVTNDGSAALVVRSLMLKDSSGAFRRGRTWPGVLRGQRLGAGVNTAGSGGVQLHRAADDDTSGAQVGGSVIIPVNCSLLVPVLFTPPATSLFRAALTLRFAHGAAQAGQRGTTSSAGAAAARTPGEPTATIALTGRGREASVELAPTELRFDDSIVGNVYQVRWYSQGGDVVQSCSRTLIIFGCCRRMW